MGLRSHTMLQRTAKRTAAYLRRLQTVPERSTPRFPFTLPFVQTLDLEFTSNLTLLVGENGSGKSTLLEALADLCRLRVGGGAREDLAAARMHPNTARRWQERCGLTSWRVRWMRISFVRTTKRILRHCSTRGSWIVGSVAPAILTIVTVGSRRTACLMVRGFWP